MKKTQEQPKNNNLDKVNSTGENKNIITEKRIFEKLRTRLLSILIIIALVVPSTLIAHYGADTGRIIGYILFSLFGMYAFFEFAKHIEFNKWSLIYMSMLFLVAMLLPVKSTIEALLGEHVNNARFISKAYDIYSIGIPVMALSILFVIEQRSFNLNEMIYVAVALMVISIFTRTVFYVAIHSYLMFLLIVSAAIVCDVFAYFFGFAFGKHKMAPNISPKKTYEGAIAGFIFSGIFVGFYSYYTGSFASSYNEIASVVSASILLPIAAIMGDLFFSAFKRSLNIKDFSSIMPGHGGLLDRIDSHIFVAITFTMILGVSSGTFDLGL